VKIFISYRRTGSSDVVGRLRDLLVAEFGESNVFMDVYSIAVGADFRHTIRDAIDSIDVLLLAIGPGFDTARLQQDDDYLRLEISAAVRHDKLIVPFVHGNATMPAAAEFPDELREIAFRNTAPLRGDPDFARDAASLVAHLRRAEAGLRDKGSQHKSCRRYAMLAGGALCATALVGAAVMLIARDGSRETGASASFAASSKAAPTTGSAPSALPASTRKVQILSPADGGSIRAIDDIVTAEFGFPSDRRVWILVKFDGDDHVYPQGPCDNLTSGISSCIGAQFGDTLKPSEQSPPGSESPPGSDFLEVTAVVIDAVDEKQYQDPKVHQRGFLASDPLVTPLAESEPVHLQRI
jgi:hypothetical protein